MDLLKRLRERPGGERLLAAATPGTYLVGGAVRDLLLERAPRELDVVVEGDAAVLAAALASAPGASAVEHLRFGTATVTLPDGVRVDVATARRERYPAPGALPEVEPAPLAEDLLRRDFTVNALALALAGPHAGELQGVAHARDDLQAGRLRVLHERSFEDDPTRLLRLARYHARLRFDVEQRTAALAAAAVAGGALGTVSGARLGAELRLALVEPDPLAALAAFDRLGVLHALHPRLRFEEAVLRRALALLGGAAPATVGDDRCDLSGVAAPPAVGDDRPGLLGGAAPAARGRERRRDVVGDDDRPGVLGVAAPLAVGDDCPGGVAPPTADEDRPDLLGGATSLAVDYDRPGLVGGTALPTANDDRPDLLVLAGLVLPLALRAGDDPRTEIVALLDRFELPAGERDRVAAAAVAAPALVDALPTAATASALWTLARRAPPEGVALAGALGVEAAPAARRWLGELRGVRLRITGDDLLAAGLPEGPEVGRRLQRTLWMRLDGELSDERDAQLRAALAPG